MRSMTEVKRIPIVSIFYADSVSICIARRFRNETGWLEELFARYTSTIAEEVDGNA